MRPDRQYESGGYLQNNPTWDVEDSPWKASKVLEFINENNLRPSSICEIGCGAGAVLANLRTALKDVDLCGFDISPDAASFWKQYAGMGIKYEVGDFFERNVVRHDLVLLLDVIEHIADPWTFLENLKPHGSFFLFHIPLDMSAQNILRETPILEARRKVGHIHYFTKNLALELFRETGYEVLAWKYTNMSLTGPRSSWKSRMAYLPRFLAYLINKDFGVRLLGGETLLVLAQPDSGI